MANIFDRLGKIFGRKQDQAADTTVAESPPETAATAPSSVETSPSATQETPATPPDMVSAPPPPSEATPSDGPAAEAVSSETAPSSSVVAEPSIAPQAPPAEPEPIVAPVEPTTPPPAVAETVEAVPAAEPTTPELSQQDRLWAETDNAWAQEDWEQVVQSLTALRVLEPERSAEIDEKLGAANYNWAAKVEQVGDLERALWLYEEAQRRNPNLGEASFAIERLQAQLQPASAEAPAPGATPAEQTYTVQEGDNLSAIAERFYGSQAEWSRIYEANRDQIDNPDLIHPGQTLKIPS